VPESDIARTALKFVNEVNRHDIEGLLAMLSDDHLFVDALGQEVRGRERLRETWRTYFDMFPDFHLAVKEWFQNGRVVAMFGTASGTLAVGPDLPAENRWRVPAAWRAMVRDQQITHWQVFADNEPVRKLRATRPP
jgi:ketosteroid isomerase-like protein